MNEKILRKRLKCIKRLFEVGDYVGASRLMFPEVFKELWPHFTNTEKRHATEIVRKLQALTPKTQAK